MEHTQDPNHYKGFFLSAGGFLGGIATHIYGFLSSSRTAVVLGNLVLIVSMVAGIYSLYTNHKLNKLNDRRLKDLERRARREED